MGMRIGGLASGMDIDQLVGDLMKAERIPLDKLFAKKTTFEWQRDSFRSINTKLKSFDEYLFNNFTLSSNFNKKSVTNSNPSLLSSTATSTATSTLSIESVSQLASAGRQLGGTVTNSTTGFTAVGSDKMSDIGVTDTSIHLRAIKTDGTLATEDTIIDIKSTDTIQQVVSKINNSNAGVSALFENGKLSITAKNTGDITNGTGAEVIVSSGNNVFTQLGMADSTNLATGGTNALFNVNGIDTSRSTNTFTISGYNVTLQTTFNTPDDITLGTTVPPVTLTASSDVNSMVDKVKEFVEKYNELISGMNSSLKEKKYRDFPPLTDEQRKDMSETEQKNWDEKAKSGLLKNDSIVSSGLTDMRNSIYGRVGTDLNVIDTLTEMGVTTSSAYSDGGKLVINEDKLRKALTANPDQVVKTLTQSGTKATEATATTVATEDTRGLIQRLRDSMKEFTGNIERKAGKASSTDQQYTMGRSLIETNDRISDFQRRLQDTESRYWRQFTAMEKAISQANQQSAMLMGQMGGQ